MKNLRKISRDQLKSVKGGVTPVPQCKIGFHYECLSVGVCDDMQDLHDCSCECVPNKK